ncbi:hypothetical protein GDO81_029056 [Engystomops pustulosus]|uniref:ATP synthase F0 subunit 8 n=1 Tax=Engystomops pustulosus TaxID=76066 RepID=A0AAV6Z292_ENGPU|nr:hypothetical protein GDO81_029056 [Engystomops pustulosus]
MTMFPNMKTVFNLLQILLLNGGNYPLFVGAMCKGTEDVQQVSGWLLIALVAVIFFLILCVARCCSPLTYLHLRYWTSYVNNEQTLFEQAADQHSKVYAMQNIKKFFGFSPGSKNISEIRIPSRNDWKTISGLDLLKVVNLDYCHYSLLHAWADEEPTDGKVISIDVGQVPTDTTLPVGPS